MRILGLRGGRRYLLLKIRLEGSDGIYGILREDSSLAGGRWEMGDEDFNVQIDSLQM